MTVRTPIYMDHNATTPVDERVFDAMKPFFLTAFGNAASRTHCFGIEAEQAVERARRQVATLLGAEAKEVVWTSGATESNNLAIKGVAYAYRDKPGHIISQSTEHQSVIDAMKRLVSEGWEVTSLPVDAGGRVNIEQLVDAIRSNTVLVSIMWANNETGTIQPIAEIASICRHRGILFHTDATQAVGKIPVAVREVGVDLLSCSAHKIYGPKGCGVLYVRQGNPRIRLLPIIDGGGHERGYRSGTLNVPGIVGMGMACQIAQREMEADARGLAVLRDTLEAKLLSSLDRLRVNGDRIHRLPHVSNISFCGIDSESLLLAVDDVALSSGSACTSASIEPSHVLSALGVDDEASRGAVRFGLGRCNTAEEVEYVVSKLVRCVRNLREIRLG